MPIDYFYDREVLVEKVSIPPDVKKGETVNINVVIRASEPTRGTLQIFQKADNYRAPAAGNEQPVPVELDRGINVRQLKQLITEPNFYTFSAEFVPDKDSGDKRAINNVAEGFTHARGKAQALLIEGTRGEHAELVKALREKEIEVRVLAAPRIDGSGGVGGDPLPTDLAQLQPYDTVILANVPKESFTESQHQLLAANCHDMGSGLVMLGGADSFGAGGWMNTPVEKALPVDMQIKAIKVQGIGAMVLIMHASEIAEGNYWQAVVAKAAISSLSSYDYCGLLHWEGQEAWLFTSAADRHRPPQHAPRHRPHDSRRHARLRPVALDGHEGLERDPRRDEQAHRDHQRRRPDAAQQQGHQPARRQQGHGHHGADRRARQRPGGDERDAQPGPADQGQFLQRHQPQGPAADLPEGSTLDLAPADLRAADALAAQDQLSRSPSRSWASPKSCRRSPGSS